mgnify:CR=1 FL=1
MVMRVLILTGGTVEENFAKDYISKWNPDQVITADKGLLYAKRLNIKPDIIFIPVPSFHQEHKWVYECSIAATRTTKNADSPKSVIAYEYPPAGWGDSGSWSQSSGSIYVDISKHLERKISILGKHESQMSNVENSLISLDAVRRLASFRGLESSVNYAELLRSKITY